MLSISPRTLWTLTQRGEVRCVRVTSRCIRYSVAALQEYIAQREAAPQAPGEK